MFLEKSHTVSCIGMKAAMAFVAAAMLLSPGGCSKSPNGPPVDNKEIVLLTPRGGETFHVGDTLKVTWKVQGLGLTDINAVDINFSPDSGKTWGLFLSVSSIFPGSAQWENFSWKIPSTFDFLGTTINLTNDSQCMLRVEQYDPPDTNQISATKGTFTILP